MQRPLFQGRLYSDGLPIRTCVPEDVSFQEHSSSHYSPPSGPHEQNTVTPNPLPQSVTHCSVNPSPQAHLILSGGWGRFCGNTAASCAPDGHRLQGTTVGSEGRGWGAFLEGGAGGRKGPSPKHGGAPLPRPGRRLPGHGGAVFLSLFTALWPVLLLEADERPLAYSRGCWNSGDLEVGGAPTRPRPQHAPR